jgi:hypothetical protein
VTRLAAIWRLARREARRDWRRLALCSVFVALGVGLGIASFSKSREPAAHADLTIFSQPAAPAPPYDHVLAPLRSWPRRAVQATALGETVTVTSSGVRVRPAHGTALLAPPGSRAASYDVVTQRLIGRNRVASARLADADLRDPLLRDRSHVVAGRAPSSAGEVALTRTFASDLDVGLGNDVRGPSNGAALHVVGLIDHGPETFSGQLDGMLAPRSLLGAPDVTRVWLISIPAVTQGLGGGEMVRGSGGATFGASTSYSAAAAAPVNVIGATIAQVFSLVLPLYLMAAILAIGLQRRARERGLLVLAGADMRTLRLLAWARGAIVALAATALAAPSVAAITALLGRGPSVGLTSVLLPCALAIVGCAIASASAERTAMRLVEEQRQGGRIPSETSVRRSLARGVVLFAAATGLGVAAAHAPGAVALIAMFAATCAGLAGLGILAPAALGIPGLVPLPGSLRAAARGPGRVRWVATPAVVAFALSLLLVSFLVVGLAGSTQQVNVGAATVAVPAGDSHLVAVRPATRSDASGRVESPRGAAEAALSPGHPLALVELRRLARSSAAADALAGMTGSNDPGVYAVAPGALRAFGVPPRLFRGHGIVAHPWAPNLPHRFVALADVPRLHLHVASAPTWLARFPGPVTPSLAQQLVRSAAGQGLAVSMVQSDGLPLAPTARTGSDGGSGWSSRAQLVVACVAFGAALLLGAIVCALAAAERREDTRRLALAGASPRDQRLAAAVGAGSLTAAGSLLVLAVLLNILLVAAYNGGAVTFMRVVAPLAPALFLTPLLLALGAAVLTRPGRDAGRIGRRPAAAPLLPSS